MSLVFRRLLSASAAVRSHIGAAPLYLLPENKLSVAAVETPRVIRKGKRVMRLTQKVTVEGPLGSASMELPDFVSLDHDAASGQVAVTVHDAANKSQRAMWGTVRSTLGSHVQGVNEGHMAFLKFVGTGYRAALEDDGKFVSVKVGASIRQGLPVPPGVTVKSPAPTLLIIEGCVKQQVNLFAASLRMFHPPEPYKGKGIYMNNETIKLKDKKIK
ncbi:ADL130Wp [Eremothecium gossypii ATCC 10895]|uniref:Large ribosomal subunit protein uL6m n=1 Tax=Eremothecium gossypii (strain ATCC 10895 / CBS 109.51 / FGSC 9923 / NRRL Y-1056) TaxID=284811 RepID=Q75AQ0_EREGS|nr:mitochondrial 54S ribosomal protein YmL16 [Eremothecium gossypii ATCC 10895]AAS51790.2 ADL130Wp [Eremothecium gossypii ATCC 10895]AEY96088.1 FADL130Wp [Eremothecium gossypii FDAG1]